MSRLLGHPHPAILASLCAGQVGPRRGRRLCAHVARCAHCAQVCERLDVVGAVLESVPAPTLPPAAERRIVTALAVESAGRTGQPGLGVPLPRSASPRPESGVPQAGVGQAGVAQAGPRARSADRRRAEVLAGRGYWPSRPRRMPRALVPALASLLVTCAGAGFLITEQLPATPGRSALSASPYQDGGSTSAFLVSDTGTKYQKSTLRSQVRDQLAEQATSQAIQPSRPGPTAAGLSAAPPTSPPSLEPGPPSGPAGGVTVGGPTTGGLTSGGGATGDGATGDGDAGNGATGSPGAVIPATEVTPSRSLVGCVLHVTGDVEPEFVDRATYQSEPVYVIVVPGEAWVVGIDCTAARPSLITSVRLGAAG